MTSVHGNASLCPSAVILYNCVHTVFVSSMFTLSAMEADSQPNVVSHYGQVYRSQKVCISRPCLLDFFFLILVGTTTSQIIIHIFYNTLYIGKTKRGLITNTEEHFRNLRNTEIKNQWLLHIFGKKDMKLIQNLYYLRDHLFGIVVSTSDCHPRGPGSIPSYTLEIFLEV